MNGDNQNKKMQKNGFTLVELLVTAVVFSIVFGSAVGILVWSIKWQKYNMSHQQLLSQSSYAIEYMARALRMAQTDDGVCGFNEQNYNVSDWGTETNNKIEFKDYAENCKAFYWDTNTNQIQAQIALGDGFSGALTSDDYEVLNLKFISQGDAAGDSTQPRVTILMEIRDKNLPNKPKIKVQTTVSQRNLDLDL